LFKRKNCSNKTLFILKKLFKFENGSNYKIVQIKKCSDLTGKNWKKGRKKETKQTGKNDKQV
jgi:hypothetical protein